jgi:hypothetical protein
MLAAVSAGTWIIVVIFILIVSVIAYIVGTKREERSHTEEGDNPFGSSEPKPPR